MASFLVLPAPVRSRIYTHVFDRVASQIALINDNHRARGVHNYHQIRALHIALTDFRHLMQVCRLIRHEIISNAFMFRSDWVMAHKMWKIYDGEWWTEGRHPCLKGAHGLTSRMKEDATSSNNSRRSRSAQSLQFLMSLSFKAPDRPPASTSRNSTSRASGDMSLLTLSRDSLASSKKEVIKRLKAL